MSSSAPQTARVPDPPERGGRTRLRPIGGNGKSLYVMLTLLGLSIVGAIAARSYARGSTIQISSNVPGANIRVERVGVTANGGGAAQISGLPYGMRNLQILHDDYQPLTTVIGTGWLSANSFSYTLKPIPLALRIDTLPGAEVLLNGKSAGSANSQGVFGQAGVMPGDYDIEVRSPGYTSFRLKRHLSPPGVSLFAGMNISPERQREAEEAQRRVQENAARFQQLMTAARQQFNARQYTAALESVDEALKLEPGDANAQQFRNQIAQTIKILK